MAITLRLLTLDFFKFLSTTEICVSALRLHSHGITNSIALGRRPVNLVINYSNYTAALSDSTTSTLHDPTHLTPGPPYVFSQQQSDLLNLQRPQTFKESRLSRTSKIKRIRKGNDNIMLSNQNLQTDINLENQQYQQEFQSYQQSPSEAQAGYPCFTTTSLLSRIVACVGGAVLGSVINKRRNLILGRIKQQWKGQSIVIDPAQYSEILDTSDSSDSELDADIVTGKSSAQTQYGQYHCTNTIDNLRKLSDSIEDQIMLSKTFKQQLDFLQPDEVLKKLYPQWYKKTYLSTLIMNGPGGVRKVVKEFQQKLINSESEKLESDIKLESLDIIDSNTGNLSYELSSDSNGDNDVVTDMLKNVVSKGPENFERMYWITTAIVSIDSLSKFTCSTKSKCHGKGLGSSGLNLATMNYRQLILEHVAQQYPEEDINHSKSNLKSKSTNNLALVVMLMSQKK